MLWSSELDQSTSGAWKHSESKHTQHFNSSDILADETQTMCQKTFILSPATQTWRLGVLQGFSSLWRSHIVHSSRLIMWASAGTRWQA